MEVAAALRVVRPGAVASRESAARLSDGDLLDPPPQRVTLTSPYDVSGGHPRLDVDRAALPASHATVVLGVPSTTPARTGVDLARQFEFRPAVVALDSLLRRTDLSRDDFRRVLDDCAGWPGIGAAERAVGFADPAAESVLESVARVVFFEQGLPAPTTQVTLGDDLASWGRVDFLWRQYRTVAEVDGRVKYLPADGGTLPVDALWREKLREERLREAGFEVVRLTWWQVTHEPARCAYRIRCAFARAERSGRR